MVFRAYLASDGVTPATGKTIAITISKDGATSFSNPAAGATNATEMASGFYKFTLASGDTGTVGPLAWRGTNADINDAGDVLSVTAATIGGLPNDGTALVNIQQLKATCNISGEGAFQGENSHALGYGAYWEGGTTGQGSVATASGGNGMYNTGDGTGMLNAGNNFGMQNFSTVGPGMLNTGATNGFECQGSNSNGDIYAPNSTLGGVIDIAKFGGSNIVHTTGKLWTLDSSGNAIAPASATTSIASAIAALNTITELVAVPGASPSLPQAIALIYMALRNKLIVTDTVKTVHNNAGTALASKTLSDTGTVYTEQKLA